ncbi:transcriptional regulator [Methylophaga sp. 42_25_T18]|nr:transcriptional regulator [Methylophaga sp. 42_25_T18]OUR89770.1 transcriptional regulator [Methylophaga sp. 42_8_T64]
MAEENDTLMEFPCDYDIKAMGPASDDFDAIVVDIIRRHVSDIKEGAVSSKHSSGGKFTSVTVNIYVTSKSQLDAIYKDLISHEQVKYLL